MVLKDTRDVLAIEKMGEYQGLYHCLNGLISPMDGIGPEDINIDSLEKRINEDQNIISLQDKIRKAQKALALSINNQEEHQKKLIEYQNLKKEFDENPLVCNYNILKENIYLQLKNLQERIKE